MQLAAFAHPDSQFDPGPFEVDVQWNQGETFLISVASQIVDFPSMGEQPPGAEGVMVEIAPRMAVG